MYNSFSPNHIASVKAREGMIGEPDPDSVSLRQQSEVRQPALPANLAAKLMTAPFDSSILHVYGHHLVDEQLIRLLHAEGTELGIALLPKVLDSVHEHLHFVEQSDVTHMDDASSAPCVVADHLVEEGDAAAFSIEMMA